MGEELERLARLRANGDLTDPEYDRLKSDLLESSTAASSRTPAKELERLAQLRANGDLTEEKYDRLRSELVKSAASKPRTGSIEPVSSLLAREVSETFEPDHSPEERLGAFKVDIGQRPRGPFGGVTGKYRNPGARVPPAVSQCSTSSTVWIGPKHVGITVQSDDGYRDGGPVLQIILVPSDHPEYEIISDGQGSLREVSNDLWKTANYGGRNQNWYWVGSVNSVHKTLRAAHLDVGPRYGDECWIGRRPKRYLQDLDGRTVEVIPKGPSLDPLVEALERVRDASWAT